MLILHWELSDCSYPFSGPVVHQSLLLNTLTFCGCFIVCLQRRVDSFNNHFGQLAKTALFFLIAASVWVNSLLEDGGFHYKCWSYPWGWTLIIIHLPFLIQGNSLYVCDWARSQEVFGWSPCCGAKKKNWKETRKDIFRLLWGIFSPWATYGTPKSEVSNPWAATHLGFVSSSAENCFQFLLKRLNQSFFLFGICRGTQFKSALFIQCLFQSKVSMWVPERGLTTKTVEWKNS